VQATLSRLTAIATYAICGDCRLLLLVALTVMLSTPRGALWPSMTVMHVDCDARA
jgi:hypothetical protein